MRGYEFSHREGYTAEYHATPIYLTNEEQEQYDEIMNDYTPEELMEGACCPFTWEEEKQ